jgi:hypothetical protein
MTNEKFDIVKTLKTFEKQWVYFVGFGLPSTLVVDFLDSHFLKNGIDNFDPKFGIFLMAPILILLSFDPNGCGVDIID